MSSDCTFGFSLIISCRKVEAFNSETNLHPTEREILKAPKFLNRGTRRKHQGHLKIDVSHLAVAISLMKDDESKISKSSTQVCFNVSSVASIINVHTVLGVGI